MTSTLPNLRWIAPAHWQAEGMTTSAPRRCLAGTMLMLLAAAGCGSVDSTPASGGDEPTTPASLAYVASDYIGAPVSARSGNLDAEEMLRDAVSTVLQLPDGKGTLVVAVGSGVDKRHYDCDFLVPDVTSGCQETQRGVLVWERQWLSDPGVVYVVVAKPGSAALVMYSGDEITGDPRTSEPSVAVSALFDIANDARVDITTSSAAIKGGDDVGTGRG